MRSERFLDDNHIIQDFENHNDHGPYNDKESLVRPSSAELNPKGIGIPYEDFSSASKTQKVILITSNQPLNASAPQPPNASTPQQLHPSTLALSEPPHPLDQRPLNPPRPTPSRSLDRLPSRTSCAQPAKAPLARPLPKLESTCNQLVGNFLIISPSVQAYQAYSSETNPSTPQPSTGSKPPELAYSLLHNLLPNIDCEQDSHILQYLIPFPQTPQRLNVSNTPAKLAEVLFNESILRRELDFGCIALNSNLSDPLPGDLARESNPHKFIYYYSLCIQDFFEAGGASPDSGETLSLDLVNKYFVIRSFYPASALFREVLYNFAGSLRQKRLERLRAGGRGRRQSEAERLAEEIELAGKVFAPLARVRLDADFGAELKLESALFNLRYRFPPRKWAYLLEAEFAAAKVLASLKFEEFLLVFMSFLFEKNLVFVSEKLELISGALALFQALLRPFKWSFPVIYSLPEELLETLGSPLPLVIGLRLPAAEVLTKILGPFADNGENCIVVFLDEGLVSFSEPTVSNIVVPEYGEFIPRLQSLYHRHFNSKMANHAKLVKKTLNGTSVFGFRKYNSDSLAQKLAKVSKGLYKPDFAAPASASGSSASESLREISNFFRTFFSVFVVAKLPGDYAMSVQGKETNVKEIDIQFFSTNEADVEFLRAFTRTQIFMVFLENDFFNIQNIIKF